MKIKLIKRLNETALFLYFNVDVKTFDAITLGNVVLAEQEDILDEGLIMHEMTHVKQFNKDRWLFYLYYLFSKRKRLAYEAEAYAKQALMESNLKIRQIRIKIFAKLLSENYGLGITALQAQQEIERWING